MNESLENNQIATESRDSLFKLLAHAKASRFAVLTAWTSSVTPETAEAWADTMSCLSNVVIYTQTAIEHLDDVIKKGKQ